MSKFYEEKLEYFGGCGQDAGYWDYRFIDINPCNEYDVCYSESDDEWYGNKLTSKSPESVTYHEEELEVTDIQECIALIPTAELPSCILAATIDRYRELNEELKVNLIEARANKAP
jgi:hypothetical protein